jgi:hypothetical protein
LACGPFRRNIFHALIELLAAGKEAVLSAGKNTPLEVCIKIIQWLVGAAARQKQCQTDNGNVSFLASPEQACCNGAFLGRPRELRTRHNMADI